MSVKPSSDYFGYIATKNENISQRYLQIWPWTALRSLGPEFFTVCNAIAMSAGVDITFFWVIVPLIFDKKECLNDLDIR